MTLFHHVNNIFDSENISAKKACLKNESFWFLSASDNS